MKTRLMLMLTIGLAGLSGCSDNNAVPGGSGFIEATETVVSAETAGRVVRVFVDEGTAVQAGNRLAELDTTTAALRLRQNEAVRREVAQRIAISTLRIEQAVQELDLAKKEYDRVSKLIDSGSIDRQLFDRTETRYNQAVLAHKQAVAEAESARAALARVESEGALLRQQFEDCFPDAPVGGMVAERYIETGEWVGAGRPLVKISRLDTVWVKVYLPPADLGKIRLGGRASVDTETAHGEPLAGTVSWISPEAEFTPKNVQTKEARADLVYAVKVTVPNPEGILKVGMPVMVTIQ